MKKVVMVHGSRNLSSRNYRISAQLEAELDPKQYEWTELAPNAFPLHPCMGCKQCFLTGRCALDEKDAGGRVKQALKEADVVIFNSPVYAHGVSGDMKILIDRLSYWLHLFVLLGKPCFTIVTTDTNGHLPVEKYLEEILLSMGGEVLGKENFYTLHSEKEVEEKLHRLTERIKALEEWREPEFKSMQEAAFQTYKMGLVMTKTKGHEYLYWKKHCYFQANTLSELYELRKGTVSEKQNCICGAE